MTCMTPGRRLGFSGGMVRRSKLWCGSSLEHSRMHDSKIAFKRVETLISAHRYLKEVVVLGSTTKLALFFRYSFG